MGNLEYVVDEPLITAFQRLAGGAANYPNLIADDCRSMLIARLGPLDVKTAWRRYTFLRPPIPGRRIQVGGWLRDMGENQGGRWWRVAAFSVDEIGTEIVKSEAVFVSGVNQQSDRTDSAGWHLAPISGQDFGDCVPGATVILGRLKFTGGDDCEVPAAIRQRLTGVRLPNDGDTELIAAGLEGLLSLRFGDDFRWGGQLSLAFAGRSGAFAGRSGERDTMAAEATVIASDRDRLGRTQTGLMVRILDSQCRQMALGHAAVTSPSPLLD